MVSSLSAAADLVIDAVDWSVVGAAAVDVIAAVASVAISILL